MNPTVAVRDATAGELVVVLVKLGRQDHRLGLWLWLRASHPSRVAGVSSVSPGVGNRPPHQHPARQVKERQAASRRLLAQPANRDGNVLFSPIGASGVKQCRTFNAQAASVVADANKAKQFF